MASISTVKVDELRVPASNFTSALAGKIAGVISYQTTGEPGADNAQFFVRGVTTFGYKTSPLILIDGFESTTNDLARLQPDDIESFSVMKDASATVMYGARSANGIISMATKAGRKGALKISFRGDISTAAFRFFLIDKARIQIGINGHLFTGHSIQSKTGTHFRNTASTFGYHNKVDDHQDGKND